MNSQKGASLTSTLIFLFAVITLVSMALKLVPMSINYVKFNSVVESSLINNKSLETADQGSVIGAFQKAIDFEGLEFKANEQTMKLVANNNGGYTIEFNYAQQKHLFWEFDASLVYDKVVTAGVGFVEKP